MRAVIKQMVPNQTAVRAITERWLKTNITAKGDYSESILSSIDLKLTSADHATSPSH